MATSQSTTAFPGHLTWTQYRDAIRDGDTDTVEKFLLIHESQALISYLYRDSCQQCGVNRRALELAVHFGQVAVFNVLFTNPALEVAASLLDYEHDGGFKWHLSRLLEIAARHGNLEIVTILTTDGRHTWIPQVRSVLKKILVASILSGNILIVRLLYELMLDLGFDRHLNVVELAYREGVKYEFLLELELSPQQINRRLTDFECPASHRIVFLGQCLDALPSKWWRFVDRFERTAIDQACVQGDVRQLELLFSKLARTDFKLTFKQNSLDCACQYGRADVVDFLLDYEWSESIDWASVLNKAIVIAIGALHLAVTKLLIQRLVIVKRGLKTKRKLLTKVLHNNKWPAPLLPNDTLVLVMKRGDVELIETVLGAMQYPVPKPNGHPVYSVLNCELYSSEELTEFFLRTKIRIFDDKIHETELNIVKRSAQTVSLVTFELLLERMDERGLMEDVLPETVRWIKAFDHWASQSRRRVYLQKLHVICTFSHRFPRVRDELETRLKGVRDLRQFNVLFDVCDLSKIFGDRKFVRSDPSLRYHAVSLLRSMCGWTVGTLRWDKLFALHVNLPQEEKTLFVKLIMETGIGVFDSKVAGDDLDFGPFNRRIIWASIYDVPLGYPSLSLKGVCRISIRQHLRKANTFLSMAEMIVSLYYDGFLPRALIKYLLFSPLPLMDTTGTAIM